MKYDHLTKRVSLNLLLERRMERAFRYAVQKGFSPLEHMRMHADMLIEHLFRMRLNLES